MAKKEEKKATTSVSLSVIDVERKYAVDTTEYVGNGDAAVSWGKDNSLCNILTAAFDKSPSLAAAINQSCNYVCGDDVIVTDAASNWKEEVNRRHQTMKDIVNHIVYDYYIYGNFALQLIFNKLGLVTEIYALDITKCRLNGSRNKVYYNKKGWSKYSSKTDEYLRFGYNDFDPENPTMILFWNGAGVRRYYNPAPWQSALDAVLSEVEASRYSLSSLVNGFSARYIITFGGDAGATITDEQKSAIEDGIRNKFCGGADADSNFMIFYGDDSQTLDVKKIESDDSPEKFEKMMAISKESILTSLRISPLLLGMGQSVGFATNEFRDAYKLFDRTVAQPVRNIIEDSINKAIGVPNGVKIAPFTITFETTEN